MASNGVGSRQRFTINGDGMEVRKVLLGKDTVPCWAFCKERAVSPQGSSEELHPINHHRFVFKEVHIIVTSGCTHLTNGLVPVASEELMVAGNGHNGLGSKSLARPYETIYPRVHIPGEYDHVCCINNGPDRLELVDFEVQVAE